MPFHQKHINIPFITNSNQLHMKYRNLVAITFDAEASLMLNRHDRDQDEDEEEIEFCEFKAISSQLVKIREYLPKFAKFSNAELIDQFLNTNLPFINYQEVNIIELYEPDVQSFEHRVYKITDGILERDVEIPHDLGLRVKRATVEAKDDHFYLPGLPNLIYEEYPFFKPDVEGSQELTNTEIWETYIKPFNKVWKVANSKHKKQELGNLRDIILYQTPVNHTNYFSFSIYEFADLFQHKIFDPLMTIYNELIYPPEKLTDFFKKDELSDEYKPSLSTECYVSLKPIGSCAESPFAFGIKDDETGLFNMLFTHVEFVNLCLGLGEGYELYFNTKKRNFAEEKITGSEQTKIDNFLKRFSKCVAICLNSKTNKFIITDYYWTGVFEIEDIHDGEIEDVKRFISRVRIRHFGVFNFENDNHVTTRNLIASFIYTTPQQQKSIIKKFDKLNNRISKEWEQFLDQKSTNLLSLSASTPQPPRKKRKESPFIFRTLDGVPFTLQKVNLVRSLLQFTAIGTQWSCQTLLVDLQKLYLNPDYKPQNAEIIPSDKPSPVLLSVYDEYYQDPALSMITRHLKTQNLKYGSTKSIENAEQVYMHWLSNLESYNKLKDLQGEVIAKVLDYGYLEDISRNNCPGTHLKTDGFYIIYEPLTKSEEELKPLDSKNEKHYEWALQAISKLHREGVSFAPTAQLIPEVFKIYNEKAYIINLEETNSMVIHLNHIRRDIQELDKFFGKKTNFAEFLKSQGHPMADQLLQEAENPTPRTNAKRSRRRSSSNNVLIQGLNGLIAESRRRGSRPRSRRGSVTEALRGLGRMNDGDYFVIESEDEEY